MKDGLFKNIFSTVAYYDVLDYPLTGFEIWKYLIRFSADSEKEEKRRWSLGEVAEALEGKDFEGILENFRGFYFLSGRKKLVARRIGREKISARKMKIIRRSVFWLRMSPFVRMIAVTGTVAMKNANRDSDLDLLVVMKKNRIFAGRILFTLATEMLGVRRTRRKIADRICLNHYLVENRLEIAFRDIFSSHQYFFIQPLFGKKTFLEFQSANSWIREFRPHYEIQKYFGEKQMEESSTVVFLRGFLEKFFNFDFLEEFLKKWQLKRINRDPRTKKAGSLVLASSEGLIFFPEPQGPAVFEKFTRRLEKAKIEKTG